MPRGAEVEGSAEALLEEGEGGDLSRSALKVDWRSMFSKLFQQQNWNSMYEFLTCAESKAGKGAGRAAGTSARRRRRDEWTAAEAAWLLVEKRLRGAVQDTLSIKPDVMFHYVQALEAVLMFFSEKLEAVPANATPPALRDLLAEPLSVVRVARPRSKGQKVVHKDDAGTAEAAAASAARCSLRVNIKDGADAAFYRLFLHATAQFYGFKSKSCNEKGARVTIVTAPAKITSSKTPMLAASVSLAGFLSVLGTEQIKPHEEAHEGMGEGMGTETEEPARRVT